MMNQERNGSSALKSLLDLGINNPLEMHKHPRYLTNMTDVNICDVEAADF